MHEIAKKKNFSKKNLNFFIVSYLQEKKLPATSHL